MSRILVCFGTRPEYIKVKSVIDNLNVKTLFTGQHKDLLKDVDFDNQIIIDNHINDHINEHINDSVNNPIKKSNRLNTIVRSILSKDGIFDNIDCVIVQGDTTSALGIALSAFHNGIKVVHLEAGLRTHNTLDPYPEEMNRQLISRIASVHLCPTPLNRENLLKEGISSKGVYITGNTGLDNISRDGVTYGNKVLVTLHRRDNHHMMDRWFMALSKIALEYPDLQFILPIHPNPNVQKWKHLLEGVNVVEPMDHNTVIKIVKECRFIISDSGGLQEEASYLGKKIIICRRMTERPEILGTFGTLCKTPEELARLVEEINRDYKVDTDWICPYTVSGTKSWKIIVDILDKNI